MLTISAEQLAEAVRGDLVLGSPDVMVSGAAIDSRQVASGAAFFAFSGQRTDGHSFAGQALDAGARALVVTRPPDEIEGLLEHPRLGDAAIVLVEDAGEALRSLAAFHRSRLSCPVIGITGSTGKTTTKDLIASVLGRTMRVVSTEGNMNNELGVPLTILRAGPATDALVLEIAMRGLGQIAALCAVARPTIGLVTNVGESHLELLGSPEAIAAAKSELVLAIPADGRVYLNADDAWSQEMAAKSKAPVVTYGLARPADVRAEVLDVDENGRPLVRVESEDGELECRLSVPGRHNAYNAAAAAAVCMGMGVPQEEIAAGLEEAAVSPMRMESFVSAAGVLIVNDAYNASPSSMRAALKALCELTVSGRRFAVLGDMAELGSLAELAHFELGEHVARCGLDGLFAVGERASRIADGAKAEGMPEARIRRFPDADSAAQAVCEEVRRGDVVLVKASRVMGLERVVEALMGATCSG
ncbi:MAG: UDP-N-acetylmuramoyl-tripeptide--D-alanyl-D-alanine ligase [Coriobacteriia bacterium]